MVNKYAIAKSTGEILYNQEEKLLYSLRSKQRRGRWFTATTQESNPPDTRTDIVLIHRIAGRIELKPKHIGINKQDNNVSKWIKVGLKRR